MGFSTGILDTMQDKANNAIYQADRILGKVIPGNDVFEQKADYLENNYIPHTSDYVEEKVTDQDAFEKGNEIGQDAAKAGIKVAEVAGTVSSVILEAKAFAGAFTTGAAVSGISGGAAVLSSGVVINKEAVLEGVIELAGSVGLAVAATIGGDGPGPVKDDQVGSKTVDGFDKSVNPGKQGKHIVGNNNYTEGRSIFNGTVDDAQKLVDEFGGTGEWIGQNKERVDFGKVIGKYVNPATGESIDTIVGMIHYSKTGTHIVPAQPIE